MLARFAVLAGFAAAVGFAGFAVGRAIACAFAARAVNFAFAGFVVFAVVFAVAFVLSFAMANDHTATDRGPVDRMRDAIEVRALKPGARSAIFAVVIACGTPVEGAT